MLRLNLTSAKPVNISVSGPKNSSWCLILKLFKTVWNKPDKHYYFNVQHVTTIFVFTFKKLHCINNYYKSKYPKLQNIKLKTKYFIILNI